MGLGGGGGGIAIELVLGNAGKFEAEIAGGVGNSRVGRALGCFGAAFHTFLTGAAV